MFLCTVFFLCSATLIHCRAQFKAGDLNILHFLPDFFFLERFFFFFLLPFFSPSFLAVGSKATVFDATTAAGGGLVGAAAGGGLVGAAAGGGLVGVSCVVMVTTRSVTSAGASCEPFGSLAEGSWSAGATGELFSSKLVGAERFGVSTIGIAVASSDFLTMWKF